MARTFYRVTRTNPPKRWDFLSNVAKNRPAPDDNPETLRLWAGVSVYDSEAKARERAAEVRGMGHFIATLVIADGGPIRWERTTRTAHHYTIWGEPDDMLAAVTSVAPL